ncbi:DNA-directed RNA polymerase subunit beta [Paenibacillus yonginensis]|uniref:DNA-directed RNA polymerase subunit beta n=1 Tax=Paenibacillus yonginensis TaxID=1462996 RepID=A0A1B1N0L3_9BACL|nr:stalk domain-containing protein [Paenibacillus yonginensis]ANS74955.1 DNA-directed RNA polymerase subunit beta [Paenibacillus yonginensis]
MKFRRLLLSTILAASQMAMILPNAGADAASTQATGQTYQQGDSASSASTDPSAQDSANPDEWTNPPATPDPSGSPDSNLPADPVSTPDPSAPADASGSPTTGTPTENPGSPASTSGSLPPSSTGAPANSAQAISAASPGKLILLLNSNIMYQNGIQYKATEPMAVKDGVSYVAIRSLVNRVGLAIRYDSATKETVITRGSDEMRFKLNSNTYKVNGVVTTMRGKSYATKNSNFMVPFTSITAALKLPYVLDTKTKLITLDVTAKPTAKFTVLPNEIIAGETQVTYQTMSTAPAGQSIVNEEWTGRQEIFSTPGSYVVSYRVQDSAGNWSDWYSVTINVEKPHTPPVAAFTTDKDTYKMGEKITYIDQSTDEENSITSAVWENNKLAFFTPGPQTVRLKVTNKYGLTSTVEHTITISGETLYNESDFNKLFVPVGDKYQFEGSEVPSWDKVNYTFTTEPVTLIRSNSPETNYSEGILYRETTVGRARFMIHHANAVGKDVKMYVVATNLNDSPANLYIDTLGFAGPNENATATGKLSVKRYFSSMQTRSAEQDITIAPREQKIIFSELSAQKMKPGQVISLLSDIYTDYPVQFDVIMIDASKDPLNTLPQLSVLDRDGVHNRGTYPEATRSIQYDEVLGDKPKRLLIGDNASDPFQTGFDTPFYTPSTNAGNFGVLYKIRTTKVAPHTLITFNPRGGTYVGSIMVNGMMVDLPVSGVLNAPNDAAVLYRTGDREETIDFVFTAAPGSNLSVNLLFQPLPEVKPE